MYLPCIVLVLLWAYVRIQLYLLRRARNRRFRNPQDCHNLIAGRPVPDFQPNQLTPYEARSIPNRRHLRAFGIENAFTTSDETYAQEFVTTARKMVNLSILDWNTVTIASRRLMDDWIGNLSTTHPKRELVPLVQALSLHAVLWAFFPSYRNAATNEANDQFDALVNLAERINRAWIASKEEATLIPFENNHGLQTALTTLLPDHDIFSPRENPLNLILPGFETLWRLVLRTFLEIGYKTGEKHPIWRHIIGKYAERPFSLEFIDTSLYANGPSARYLVSEALRLYSPTRRVYRAWKEESGAGSSASEMAADIDACHMDKRIWGADAARFNPMRWRNTTEQQERAFLPFGCKPFECPAKAVFGPRMIGLLVGTMLNRLEREKWELVDEEEERVVLGDGEEGEGARLDNARDAYYGLALVNVDFVPCGFFSS